MMFEELLHDPRFREAGGSAGVPVLIMFSLLRDDFPWLYELGVQLYHAIDANDLAAVERARRTIIGATDMMMNGPFMLEMRGSEDEETMMALHHLMRSLDRLSKPNISRKASQSEKTPK